MRLSVVSGKIAGVARSPGNVLYDEAVADFQRKIDGNGTAEKRVHSGTCFKPGCYPQGRSTPPQQQAHDLYLDAHGFSVSSCVTATSYARARSKMLLGCSPRRRVLHRMSTFPFETPSDWLATVC